MRKSIKFNTEYKVASSDVFLDVVIGEGQSGSISVSLNDTIIDQENEFVSFPIGNGNDIKGKTLTILSEVSDMLINTNRTSVTFALSGGVSDYKHTCKGTVDVDKDKIEYEININLN
jgi:hypothetical protein